MERGGRGVPGGSGIPVEDIRDRGMRELLDRLLGHHGPQEREEPPPWALEGLREIVARWPREAVVGGRDLGGVTLHRSVRPADPRARVVATVRRALMAVAGTGDPAAGAFRRVPTEVPSPRPWYSARDRRGAVLQWLGHPPLLWSDQVVERRPTPVGRAHLYLDVSGSMNEVIGLLYGALRPLAAWIHPRVHLFSTEVHDVTLAALRRGDLISTFGTEISCVTGHMVEQGVRRAVVITDGFVGRVPREHVDRLRGLKAVVLLTAGGSRDFAPEIGARVIELPHLERGT